MINTDSWDSITESLNEFMKNGNEKVITISAGFRNEYDIMTGREWVPGFNKVIVRRKSFSSAIKDIELSWDADPDQTRSLLHKLSEEKTVVKGDVKQKPSKSPDPGTVELLNALKADNGNDAALKAHPAYQQVEAVVRQYFTDTFSGEVLEGETSLAEQLLKKQSRFMDKQSIFSESPVFRLEENRDDYTVVLAISPFDLSMKLAWRNNDDYEYANPLTGFYETYYEPVRYRKEVKKHALLFFEVQGYEMNPDFHRNRNIFKTVFGCQKPADYVKMLPKSAAAQMRFTHQLMAWLSVFYGQGFDGKGLLQTDKEQMEIDLPGLETKIRLYNASRIYSSPFSDAMINAGVETDSTMFENEVIFASVESMVKPYAGDVPGEEVYHHPLVYEAWK